MRALLMGVRRDLAAFAERLPTILRKALVDLTEWALIAIALMILAGVLLALVVSYFMFGFWMTFVGALLIAIALKVYSYDRVHRELKAELKELKSEIKLAQHLAKGVPAFQQVSVSKIESGVYLFGGILVGSTAPVTTTGNIMVLPEAIETDPTWIFSPNARLEITDRSILAYEGGRRRFNDTFWSHLNVGDYDDLADWPPAMLSVPASELHEGQYLFGGILIAQVDTLGEPDGVMVIPNDQSSEPTWFFVEDELVEVTERSILDHEGGRERFQALMWARLGDPKEPPPLRKVRALGLHPGLFLFGRIPIFSAFYDYDSRMTIQPSSSGEPMIFDKNEVVEVTERSLLCYEGGKEASLASMGRERPRLTDGDDWSILDD